MLQCISLSGCRKSIEVCFSKCRMNEKQQSIAQLPDCLFPINSLCAYCMTITLFRCPGDIMLRGVSKPSIAMSLHTLSPTKWRLTN
jgi:hypothetical protein